MDRSRRPRRKTAAQRRGEQMLTFGKSRVWKRCAETGKRRYGSEAEAERDIDRAAAMVRLGVQQPGRKAPVRHYRCPHCNGVHLSSRNDWR